MIAWSELSDDEKKLGLLRNFGYRLDDLYYYENSDGEEKPMLLSPNKDSIKFDEAWEWLEYNGVSLNNSYQYNMSTYLSKHGFTRRRIYGKTVVFNLYNEQITQIAALRFIDRKRGLPKEEKIEQQITTNLSKTERKTSDIQRWASERKHNQSFQSWLLEKRE